MNYSKSLSELLFEEKDEKVATIEEVGSVPFLLVPPDKLKTFIEKLRNPSALETAVTQFFAGEARIKSQTTDKPEDVKQDTTAQNVPGLDRGEKTYDIAYTFIENKLDTGIAEKFQAAFKKAKGEASLGLLNAMQLPYITIGGKKFKFDFINRTGEDTLKATSADFNLFDKLGHAFFVLVLQDPENPKEVVYYTNGGNVVVFAHPITEEFNQIQFNVHDALFDIEKVKSEEQSASAELKDIQDNFVHAKDLFSLLFESDNLNETQGASKTAVSQKAKLFVRFSMNALKDYLTNVLGVTKENAPSKKEQLQSLIDELRGEGKFYDDTDELDEAIVYIQDLITPPTEPPSSISPPSGDDDYGDNVHAGTVNRLPGEMDGINILKDPDKDDVDKVNAIKSSMKISHKEKLEAALKDKDKDRTHKIKIDYTPINNGKRKSIECDVKWNGSKWVFVIENNIYVYGESFVYKEGLSLLLEADSTTGFRDFQLLSRNELEDDMDMLDLADDLSFALIDKITVSDKEEKTAQRAPASPESSPAGPAEEPSDDSQPAGDATESPDSPDIGDGGGEDDASPERAGDEADPDQPAPSDKGGEGDEDDKVTGAESEAPAQASEEPSPSGEDRSGQEDQPEKPEGDKQDDKSEDLTEDQKQKLSSLKQEIKTRTNQVLDLDDSLFTNEIKITGNLTSKEDLLTFYAGFYCFANNLDVSSLTREKIENFYLAIHVDRLKTYGSLSDNVFKVDGEQKLIANCNAVSKGSDYSIYAILAQQIQRIRSLTLTESESVSRRDLFDRNMTASKAKIQSVKELFSNNLKGRNNAKISIDLSRVFTTGNVDKDKQGKMINLENIKQTIEEDLKKIYAVFSAKKGLSDINLEKISLEKFTSLRDYKIEPDKIYNVVQQELSDSEIGLFLIEFLTEFLKRLGGNRDIANAVLEKALDNKSLKKELETYFDLQSIESLLKESKKRNKNLLNENWLLDGAVDLFGSGVDTAIDGILTLIGSSVYLKWGCLILAGIGVEWTTGAISGISKTSIDLAKSYFKNLEESSDKEGKWLATIISSGSTIQNTRNLVALLVSATVSACLTKRYNFAIVGSLSKIEEDSNIDKNIFSLLEREINGSITQQTQADLFTKTFRDNTLKEKEDLNEEQKDQELIKAYESRLDNIVLGFMNAVMQNEAAAASQEKAQLAYRNRMDVMDNEVLGGMAVGASAAIGAVAALSTSIVTGGLSLAVLAAPPLLALIGGKKIGDATRAGQRSIGPLEAEFLNKREESKQIIRLIVIELAKKSLGIKESLYSDDFLYRHGLSLLIEGLSESILLEEEEGEEGEKELEKEEPKQETNKNIRGSISFNELSDRLEADGFFLYSPELKLAKEQNARNLQYSFASSLAAVTRYCFGVDITGVDKMSIRDAQANSFAEMLVNGNAGIGEGSIRGGRSKGGAGKGLEDTVTMEEFLALINNFDGDTTKAALFLMVNGKLNGLLNAVKGGKQSVQEVIESIGSALSGNLDDFPRNLKDSAEEAIQNLNSDEWVGKVIEAFNKDAPIIFIYDENQINLDQVTNLFDNQVAGKLKTFASGYESSLKVNTDRPLSDVLDIMSLDRHKLFITKTVSGNNTQYRFTCEEKSQARRLIASEVRFVKKSEDDAQRDKKFKTKVILREEQSVWNQTEFIDQSDDKIASKIAVAIIIKAMRKSASNRGFYTQYFKTVKDTDLDQLNISGRMYTRYLIKLFLNVKVQRRSPEEVEDNPDARAERSSFNIGQITKALKAHHERHLDLYKMWKSR